MIATMTSPPLQTQYYVVPTAPVIDPYSQQVYIQPQDQRHSFISPTQGQQGSNSNSQRTSMLGSQDMKAKLDALRRLD